MIWEAIARGWENFLARPEGPLNLRFILQPLIALAIAIKAGVADARDGRSPYLWRALNDSTQRQAVLRNGWKDIQISALISATFDAAYQLIIHNSIFLFELLFTVTLLVVTPYLLFRGPVNRVVRLFIPTARAAEAETGGAAPKAAEGERKRSESK